MQVSRRGAAAARVRIYTAWVRGIARAKGWVGWATAYSFRRFTHFKCIYTVKKIFTHII